MSININTIKTSIKSILDTANTTTASTDLSSGMSNRVVQVFKVNPQLIPIQSTLFPYVTISITEKTIDRERSTFVKNQSSARRMARLGIEIVGGVWMSQVTNIAEDPADEEIELLMENIEQVIRDNATLDGNVKWTEPGTVTYHSARIESEQTNLRIGIFDLDAIVDY